MDEASTPIGFANDSLVVVTILEYLSTSPLDILSFGQVCQTFRKMCLCPATKLSFSNYLPIINDHDENNYDDHDDRKKKYLPLNCDASFSFLDYFTSIHLGCEFPAVDLDFAIDRVLLSTKCEELSLKNLLDKCELLECCDIVSNLSIDELISFFPYLKHLKIDDCCNISYKKELFEFSPKFQRLCEYLTSLSVTDAFYDLLTTSVQFSQLTELTIIVNIKKEEKAYFESNDYYLDSEQFPKLKHLTLKVPSFCVQLNLPSLETLVLEAKINTFDVRSANTLLKLDNLKQLDTSCVELCKSRLLQAPKLENLIQRNGRSSSFSIPSSFQGFPIEKLKKLVIINTYISFDEIIQYSNLEHLELDIARMGSSEFEKLLGMQHLKFVKINTFAYGNPEHIKIEEELKRRNVIVKIVKKP